MSTTFDLSPLGTARGAVVKADAVGSTANSDDSDQGLLTWFQRILEPLKSLYGMDQKAGIIAWELARWQPGLDAFARQSLLLLVVTALIHLREGSTRLCLRGEKGRKRRLEVARRLTNGLEPISGLASFEPERAVTLVESLIDSGSLSVVVGAPNDFKPLVVSGDYLYLQKMLDLEDRFTAALTRRLKARFESGDPEAVERALSDELARPSVAKGVTIRLTEEQIRAVRAAVIHPVTIISGGPGSGKTTIVLSILRTLGRLGIAAEEIALAAPTGKAANRMAELIGASADKTARPTSKDDKLANLSEPQTLHRLLGYSRQTGRFLHHENNRLAARVVIVDEGSMIDLAMMERLVRALRDDAKLIVLGDARQLPSVDAGNVLRDLLDFSEERVPQSQSIAGVTLRESHRMREDDDNGRVILAVARAIDQGDRHVLDLATEDRPLVSLHESAASLTFRGVEFVMSQGNPSIVEGFLDRWFRDLISADAEVNEYIERVYRSADGRLDDPADRDALDRCFKHWERFRLLCVTRVSRGTGADDINAGLHHRFIRRPNSGSRFHESLIAGEPVVIRVNDYGRGLFNGDQGIVLYVVDRNSDETRPTAVFRRPDGFACFHLDVLRPVLVHGYAMTVHKAQGSEFNTIGLILPDHDLPINSREVLYTALTRSRQGVAIVGSRQIFEAGIERTIARDSGMVDKLCERR